MIPAIIENCCTKGIISPPQAVERNNRCISYNNLSEHSYILEAELHYVQHLNRFDMKLKQTLASQVPISHFSISNFSYGENIK